ncbi:NADPH-dependent 7-cyano-7-deazaguanine reductase QueF [Marinobacter sp. SS8-8]|uniref:NADPH-dependent 7-cyano-7-deazaguanine reductase QueF n=1 Tax=Marinobacter sp. SS8-8 TaxID=3050452 RepID=UPI000C54E927|nr:NADPH-dependent 7-cyano-7-deazaguanine reductase QueF [Marinobacter sp. SS8-8]MAZ06514.1 NADPH-dependent 7-cyano-7-deazaguanine reductase QueF [Halomonas sp.]|tara:strand:+ start:13392 stop:14216 length:825 start_codon:yes stop_codon:yes gene_type:complete
MALNDAPLGKTSDYPASYNPGLLFPVAREENRRRLGLDDGRWRWFGEDLWQAWEISWLRPGGVPEVAWAEIVFPAASPSIIESKSMKLYLNSLNQAVYSSRDQVAETITQDLSSACGGAVQVTLLSVDESGKAVGRPRGFELIDNEPVSDVVYDYAPDSLSASDGGGIVTEHLCSHLLKSNCPVTGQPDWATLLISYTGRKIDRAGLLRYVVSFRQKQDFHEHCVETVFTDLMSRCKPESLTVRARYTRRGGLDINPWRSTEAGRDAGPRLIRQ